MTTDYGGLYNNTMLFQYLVVIIIVVILKYITLKIALLLEVKERKNHLSIPWATSLDFFLDVK